MDNYEIKYISNEYGVTFDLKFDLNHTFIYLENSDVDLYYMLDKNLTETIDEFLIENYSHIYEEMENNYLNQINHLIKTNKI